MSKTIQALISYFCRNGKDLSITKEFLSVIFTFYFLFVYQILYDDKCCKVSDLGLVNCDVFSSFINVTEFFDYFRYSINKEVSKF